MFFKTLSAYKIISAPLTMAPQHGLPFKLKNSILANKSCWPPLQNLILITFNLPDKKMT